jgi:hypothetical protein
MTDTLIDIDSDTDTDVAATVRATLVDAYGPDWARAINHVAEVVDTYRTDGPVLVFNLARANDVHGYDDPVSVSNYRVLASDWADVDALFTGTWSNVDAIGLRLDAVAPDGLTDVIDALESYPVLDESVWSEVEQETIRDHWESYGRFDALCSVADVLGVSRSDLSDYAETAVETLVWSGVLDYGYGSGYPSMVDPSSCDFGTDAVSNWVREHVGNVESVTVDRGYGEPLIVDTRREVWVRSV